MPTSGWDRKAPLPPNPYSNSGDSLFGYDTPQYGGGGTYGGYLDPMYNVFQGMNTMQNLGNTIGSGFGFANLLNSANARAQYEPAANVASHAVDSAAQQRISELNNQALNNQTAASLQLGQGKLAQGSTILPMLIAALSSLGGRAGGSGGIGGMNGFTTNFGQGASLTGAATPQTPRATGIPNT